MKENDAAGVIQEVAMNVLILIFQSGNLLSLHCNWHELKLTTAEETFYSHLSSKILESFCITIILSRLSLLIKSAM